MSTPPPMISDAAQARAASFTSRPRELFIAGRWQAAQSGETFDVVDPANERVFARAASGGEADIDAAVKAARKAFESPPWASFTPAQRALMDLGLVEIAAAGAALPLLDYLAAVKAREIMGVAMNLFHQRWDLLLTPTLPIPAFAAGREVPDGDTRKRWTNWTPFTYPFNLTRQPAATVPCGFTRSGLPIGLQIVGRVYDDATVLRAARAFGIR